MDPRGEYYLHENGKLIYKPNGDVDVMSVFVKGLWRVSELGKSPKHFVRFLRQAHEKGAKRDEIMRLAKHNDLEKYEHDWQRQVFGKGAK